MPLKMEGLYDEFDRLDAAPVVPEYVNLVPNPSMEAGISRWSLLTVPANRGSLAPTSTGARFGSKAMAVSATDVEEVAVSVVGPTGAFDGMAVVPGQFYSGRASVTGSYLPNSTVRLVAYFYDDANESIRGYQGPTQSGSGLLDLTISGALAPAGSAYAVLQILVIGTMGNASFSVDAAMFAAGTLRSFFDGNSPGASWIGTPNASASSTAAQVDTEAKWLSTSGASVTRNRLRLTPVYRSVAPVFPDADAFPDTGLTLGESIWSAAQILSSDSYDLRGSSVSVKVTPGASPTQVVRLAVGQDEENSHAIVLTGTTLTVERTFDGDIQPSIPLADLSASSDDEVNWWRIASVNGEVMFAVSFDGVFWDERVVTGTGFDVADVTVTLSAEESEGTMGEPSYFESFNVPANQFGDRLYRGFPQGWTDRDPETGFTLLKYCRAIGEAYAVQYQLAAGLPGEDPWAILLDVDRSPVYALPWLATLAGVRVPKGMPAKKVRALIKAQANTKRGTRAALEAAIKDTLTGSKHVEIIERDGNAYLLTIRTGTDETPDPAETFAAALKQKPAGIKFNYVVDGGRKWSDATGTWSAAGTKTWDQASYELV